MKVNLFLIVIMTVISTNSFAQSDPIKGLWLMEHVQVGDEEMTPVAKWTRIHSNGTYESGNGWLKSSEGTWSYNEATHTFLPEETNGLEDPFGAFVVQFEGNGMTWTREEEGMEVIVRLKRIEELPKAPADQVQGLWDLVQATDQRASVIQEIDPEGLHYLFIRWDRIYVERDSEGNRGTGYWHMNGHRPEFTMLSHNADKEPQSWKLTFINDHKMSMTGLSDSNKGQLRIYTRLKSFPE